MNSIINLTIADRIKVFPGNGLTVVVLPTQTKNVVWASWLIPGGVMHERFNPAMAAALLDKGTIHKTKNEIHDRLEDLGTTISFSSNFSLLTGKTRCLKHDLPAVVDLMTEMIMEPAFSESEYNLEKAQWISGYKRSQDDTSAQADIALAQLLFPADHPQYLFSFDERIRKVEQQQLGQVKGFFEKCGLGEMYVVLAGDVEPESAAAVWHQRFAGWRLGEWRREQITQRSLPLVAGRSRVVSIADKTNVDVTVGKVIGIDNNHPDIIPLAVAKSVLGGDFNSRLMNTVRVQKGLTYGIGALIRGPAFGEVGIIIDATFAPQLLKQGIDATREVMRTFFDQGVTTKELDDTKKTLTGKDLVAMATTNGLVADIESALINARPLSYIDEWRAKIEAVTLDDVQRVIKQYFDPDTFAWAYAGSVSEADV